MCPSDAKTDAAQSEKGNKKPTLASSEMTVQKEARQLNEGMITPVEKDSSKPVKQGGNMQKNKAKEKQKQALNNSATPGKPRFIASGFKFPLTLNTPTSVCIFSTLFYAFSNVLTRRICLTIKSFFSW